MEICGIDFVLSKMNEQLHLEEIAIKNLYFCFDQSKIHEFFETEERDSAIVDSLCFPLFPTHAPLILDDVYKAFVSTCNQRLEDVYLVLYKALQIAPRERSVATYKLIKNNINYKLRTRLLLDYPYLAEYGKKFFTLYRIWAFPQILLVDPTKIDHDLKKKFRSFTPEKRPAKRCSKFDKFYEMINFKKKQNLQNENVT